MRAWQVAEDGRRTRSQDATGHELGPCWLGSRGLGMAGTGAHGGRAGEQSTARREGSATPTLTHPQAREVPGVKVFRSSATVYFANAELYSDALKKQVRPGSPRCVVEGPPPPLVPTRLPLAFASSVVWMLTTSSPRRRRGSRSRS